MEKIETIKSAGLLEEGLDVLHQESQEWLSEVAFWKDEVEFYYGLVVRKTIHKLPVTSKDAAAKIEGELIRITGGELDQLQQEIEMHEYYLNQLLESKQTDEERYREKHKLLLNKIHDFETKFKSLKADIFKLTR